MDDIEDLHITKKNINENIIENITFSLNEFCLNYKGTNIKHDFINYMSKMARQNKIALKKTDIILTYRYLLESNKLIENISFEKLMCKKPSRSISGITSITLVMSPYPNGQTFSCKHNCYYCPNEPAHEGNNFQAQPRSYLYNEPAVRRANKNQFKAFEQMIDRMNTLYLNGHTIDKLEIIIEGGTYTEYPIEYLNDFNRDIYYSANTYYDKIKREPLTLSEEVYINQTTKVHIIGICIETRPDALSSDWIYHFRNSGITRIQLGVQSTHNDILKKLNRGHTIEQVCAAMEYLKNLCFKIDIHIMPDLPFSTPEKDMETFDFVYNILQPDQLKIYPCAVTPWTIIEKWYKKGIWKPYEPNQLLEVMNYAMDKCPDWIRLPRIIRDIPLEYIQAGNKVTNLRQSLVDSREIRSREIERHPEYYNKPGKIFVEKYSDKDYFISYESTDKIALFGFIRLRLPDNYCTEFSILNGKALIRELHVYGYNTAVGDSAKASQHKGIGSKLLKKAENIAYFNFYDGIAVISGEGVKKYYYNKGYNDIDTYMIKKFKYNYIFLICCFSFYILWICLWYFHSKW